MTAGREVIIEADGGSRGNPGPAGYGAVVRAADGEVLAERRGSLGVATNNVAEYQGLIAGLHAAAELGAQVVEARLDSKLVVEQMSGRWKIKNEQLRPLALQARDVAGRFSEVRYEWVPRARNAHADRLANEAMDDAADKEPPAQASPASAQVASESPPELPIAERSAGTGAGAAARTPGTVESANTARDNSPGGWMGATGAPTRVVLLRHGQTERSAQRRYSGRDDVPLTELGERQASLTARRLATAGLASSNDLSGVPVISSPLSRATQTARAVVDALGGELVTHPGLIETDFGAWEGLTFTEAAQRDPEIHRSWLADTGVRTPGGESFDDVQRRVSAVLDELVAGYGGRTIVVVSHVTPIKQLLRLGLDVGPQLLFRLHLDLASLSVVEFYPDGPASVRLVNDTSHLG